MYRHAVCLLVAAAALCRAEPPPPPAFPQDASDVQADANIRFGTLPNGVRFAVLQNAQPKDRASLRLLVLAGSLHETEEQRGLAHFLEHLAFNGSTHFPPGELVKYFQRIGMGFGNDTNAYTTYDHTAYLLELPATDPKTLNEGFRVLADYAGGLLLDPAEIERERGVILSEMRDREDADYRTFVAEIGFLFKGTRLPERAPIGIAEVVRKADRDAFLDFYNTWYRPERLFVVAVGDFDVNDVTQRIGSHFAELAARAPGRPSPGVGPLPPQPPEAILLHQERDAAAARATLQTVLPIRESADTWERRRQSLLRSLAHDALTRRLKRLAEAEGAPFSEGFATSSEVFDSALNSSIELIGPPDRWRDALQLAEVELRRALQFGFTVDEVKVVVAARSRQLEEAVNTATTRRSPALAASIVRSLAANRVFPSPQTELAGLAPTLARVTAEDLKRALQEAWQSTAEPRVFVTGNLPDVEPGEILAALAESRSRPVTPPEVRASLEFGYTDFGAPGTLVRRERVEAIDAEQVVFSNGVRANLKRTDFEANRIRLSARVGYGRLIQPKDQPGLSLLANLVMAQGGLGRHSAEELNTILSGRTARVDFSTGDDALFFSGSASPDDFPLLLQLLAAHLQDPGLRPEGFRLAAQQLEQTYNQLLAEPSGSFQMQFSRTVAGGDPRFGLPDREAALATSESQLRDWLLPQLQGGPVEITLVGDLEVEECLRQLAATVGALPRRAERERKEDLRKLVLPEGQVSVALARVTEAQPKALLAMAWRTEDRWDIRRTRRLGALTEVLSNRVLFKIREELGEAYSPACFHQPSEAYDGLGWITALVECDPKQVEGIRAAIETVVTDLAQGGITEDEKNRAVQPMLTGIIESFRNNTYWLNSVLNGSQERPERLAWPATLRTDFESITTEELNSLAARYLGEPDVIWTMEFESESVAAP